MHHNELFSRNIQGLVSIMLICTEIVICILLIKSNKWTVLFLVSVYVTVFGLKTGSVHTYMAPSAGGTDKNTILY